MLRLKLGTSVSGTALFITVLFTWLVREWILGWDGLTDGRLVFFMWLTCILTSLTSPYDSQYELSGYHSML
jgi:hypothetical protein